MDIKIKKCWDLTKSHTTFMILDEICQLDQYVFAKYSGCWGKARLAGSVEAIFGPVKEWPSSHFKKKVAGPINDPTIIPA